MEIKLGQCNTPRGRIVTHQIDVEDNSLLFYHIIFYNSLGCTRRGAHSGKPDNRECPEVGDRLLPESRFQFNRERHLLPHGNRYHQDHLRVTVNQLAVWSSDDGGASYGQTLAELEAWIEGLETKILLVGCNGAS